MVWSVLVTLLCCMPFGIVAIVKSSQVNKLLATGNVAMAKAASNSAKQFNLIGAISGFVLIGGYALVAVMEASR